MLRDDIYNFSRIGTFIERADTTARILDVKYYVLLPAIATVGSSLDNKQWESILRSVSAHRSYSWVYDGDYSPANISDFLILNDRMPRSLAYSYDKIVSNLGYLAKLYGDNHAAHETASATLMRSLPSLKYCTSSATISLAELAYGSWKKMIALSMCSTILRWWSMTITLRQAS